MQQRAVGTLGRRFGLLVALVTVAVTSTTTAAAAAVQDDQEQGNPAPLSSFVRIQDVDPNVQPPRAGKDGSTGVVTVDCGTNANGKFNADNPVAQPGIKNGAQHVHDYVGNLAIDADTSDEELEKADTTCENGDRSSYFWPVVRINDEANAGGNSSDSAETASINCPTVALPAVPDQARAEVDRNLKLLDEQIAEANQRLVDTQGQGGPDFVDNAILGPLKDKRVATLDRIAIAIGRSAPRPTGLERFAPCTLDNSDGEDSEGDEPLPGPEGPDFEIGGNVGRIVQPASVDIEYRGNAASEVVPMPKFLKMLTGESKPTERGPANARPSWTCSGFADRLSDQYVICPDGSQVMRVHDFPSCWDGQNTDSENHRDHIAFPDADSGECPASTQAVPQLRITISYDIPTDIQQKGQYQLDAFDEENHNPASDHDDFANVNADRTMAKIVDCINSGRRCS